MSEPYTPCMIWPTSLAEVALGSNFNTHVRSERAGGIYSVDSTAQSQLEYSDTDDDVKARLTTWLVDQRRQGIYRPHVTAEVIEQVKRRRSLSVDERAERLLKCLLERSNKLGEKVRVNRDLLCAWTESTKASEVTAIEGYLKECGWIEGALTPSTGTLVTRITVEGHRHLAETAAATDSFQAFVAMWFHESMDAVYEEGIKPAITEAGYNPFRISDKEHVNKIEDEIVAEIRRSRFLIADFTQEGDRARGSVYYEAGFAKGLGLEVIFTCRDDCFDQLHFDTSHYNHIKWTTPEDLHEKLRNRIRAVIVEASEH